MERQNKQTLDEMMSNIPLEKNKDIDNELLRIGIIAELDAINLYEQLAELATSEEVKKMLLDIAKEEKTHVSEFETLLLDLDKEQLKQNEIGKDEAETMKEAKERIYGKSSIQQLNEMKNIYNKLNG